ncbi:MAG: hypothetical protein WAS73_04185, partial [Defluviicoccus sp.]
LSSYTGDGTSGVFLSRAQLCRGSALIPYLETTTAAILETIGGAPSYALFSQTETVVLTAAAAEWIAATIADPPAGSVTIGSATASAANALAAGDGATASAAAAIAIGAAAAASGVASLALGETANATAENAIAIGDATASSAAAIAIGESASASNTSAIAIGDTASAAGVDCVAIGHAASLSGNYNVGIGLNAKFAASQQCNIGIGYNINPGINADADFDQNILIGREPLFTAGTVQRNGASAPSNNTLIGYRAISADYNGLISLASQNALIGYWVAHHAGTGPLTLGNYTVAIGCRLNEVQNTGIADPLTVGNGTIALGAWNNRNTAGAVTVNDYAITIGYSSNRNAVAGTPLTVGARSITLGNGNNYDSGGVIGENAIAIGSECDVSADSGIAIGRSCVVAKANAVAIGKAQTPVNAGELAFGTTASHGMVTYVLATTTTDGSTVELTTDGVNFIAIPAGKVFCFEAFQTTWNRTDGAHQVCRFSGGVIKNSGGTVTLVKTPTVIASDGAENQIAFAADDANDRLAVTITGKAGKTIETRVIITGAFLGL